LVNTELAHINRKKRKLHFFRFTSNSLVLPQHNIADAHRQESSGEGRLAIFSSKQRVKRETGASETPEMQLENDSYTPPVSDDLLDRGTSGSSAFASLGPIYGA